MIEDVKMNLAAIIVGILAALLALVLVGIATAAGALLSLVQGVVAAPARTVSKPTHRRTEVRSAKDAEVVKMPEGRRRAVGRIPFGCLKKRHEAKGKRVGV